MVPSDNRPRVIVYVFANLHLPDWEDDELRAQIRRQCQEEGFALLDLVVDRGPPKQQHTQYPALTAVVQGKADALVVVRSPLFRRGEPADWLEAACPEGPFVCLAPAELRELGIDRSTMGVLGSKLGEVHAERLEQ